MRYVLLPIGITVAFILLVASGHLPDVPAEIWVGVGYLALIAVALLISRLIPGIYQDQDNPDRIYAVYEGSSVKELTPRPRRKTSRKLDTSGSRATPSQRSLKRTRKAR
jgi:hypothetical protein